MKILLLVRATKVPLNWKLPRPLCHLGLLVALNHRSKKGVTSLSGVSYPNYQGKVELSPTMGTGGMYVDCKKFFGVSQPCPSKSEEMSIAIQPKKEH